MLLKLPARNEDEDSAVLIKLFVCYMEYFWMSDIFKMFREKRDIVLFSDL